YINERKMSVGVPKLAIFRIETMPLLLPPMEIQMQFIKFVHQVDKSKVAEFAEQVDKSKYYSYLSYQYFRLLEKTYRQEWMSCRTSDF
ncbi:MAG: hypothetical protein SOT28_00280, partial [Fusicatenibacter sp.]|nr:hypothetical protein [Fusicatenibacter sp.]